jgi:hypothetical protein
MLNAFPIFFAILTPMGSWPRSIFERSLWSMPMRSANSSCVSLSLARSPRIAAATRLTGSASSGKTTWAGTLSLNSRIFAVMSAIRSGFADTVSSTRPPRETVMVTAPLPACDRAARLVGRVFSAACVIDFDDLSLPIFNPPANHPTM